MLILWSSFDFCIQTAFRLLVQHRGVGAGTDAGNALDESLKSAKSDVAESNGIVTDDDNKGSDAVAHGQSEAGDDDGMEQGGLKKRRRSSFTASPGCSVENTVLPWSRDLLAGKYLRPKRLKRWRRLFHATNAWTREKNMFLRRFAVIAGSLSWHRVRGIF